MPLRRSHGYRGIFIHSGHECSHHQGVGHWHNESGLADGPKNIRRPLVVIDPEDREQVRALEDAYAAARRGGSCVDWMQGALRSLVAPLKPAEPQGLGAVVEDSAGERFVRWKARGRAERHWKGEGDGDYRAWSDINAVKVLSEGVS